MKRLVFHHIDKCAGTTLRSFLPNFFRHDRVLYLEHCGDPRSGTFAMPAYDVLSRAQFIHDPFNFIDWKQVLPNVTTFMQVRDPVDRLYSQWMMSGSLSDAAVRGQSELANTRETARAGFKRFLVSHDAGACWTRWNFITRQLLFGHRDIVERWDALEAMHNPSFASLALEAALEDLCGIDFIGLVEEFEASVTALYTMLALPPHAILQAHNTRGSRRYRSRLDAEALRAAQACTALDQAVYERARQLHRQQIGALRAQHGPDLMSGAARAYERRLLQPPEWALISMGDALNGSGWHEREVNGSKLSRWLGPEPVTRLDVLLRKSEEILIRLRCTNHLDPDQLGGLTLKADGVPVPLQKWRDSEGHWFFEGAVKGTELRRDDLLRIELSCPLRRPENLDDPRLLGVELTEIEIGASSGFLRQSAGTPVRRRALAVVPAGEPEWPAAANAATERQVDEDWDRRVGFRPARSRPRALDRVSS